jgi:hypothetical protein
MLMEFNENESITYQSLWDEANALLRGKFITMNTYTKKHRKSQKNHIMLHLNS